MTRTISNTKIRRALVQEGYLMPATNDEIQKAIAELAGVEVPAHLDDPNFYLKPHCIIETFLRVNAIDIDPTNRAKIREAVANGADPAKYCPEHLQDALRRIITEAQYQQRVKGQMFNPKGEYMPTAGNVQR